MNNGQIKDRSNRFHQARWNEPIILQMSTQGERGIEVNAPDEHVRKRVGDPEGLIPESMRREEAPGLPRLGQMQVLKHFLRLSQETLGADFNVEIGQGTCTMKYSPKVHEQFVRHHRVADVHPLQDDATVQGTLEILYKTDLYLREISGLDRFSFHPRSGTHAILAMASIVRKHHEAARERGDDRGARDQIITSMFSHPSDAAAAHVLGYEIVNLQQNPETGLPDIEDLEAALSDRTAAMFITNPEDTGIFNPRIREFTDLVHAAGGLCAYDQANANGLLGITRAREAGFDMCFFNLHKTFAVPHGCGGPGSGAIGVVESLERYLPAPVVAFDGRRYRLDRDRPDSTGKIGAFIGVVPAVVRTYAWVRSLGADGLRRVAQTAVLNNNYLLHHVRRLRGVSAPYAGNGWRIEQVRYSLQKLYEDTGVSTGEVTHRMCDHGMHMWASHHPFIVPNPMTLEPTEAYARAELDQYVAALARVIDEAYTTPQVVKTAPHRSCIHRVEHDWLDDPDRWAITWRAYQRKKAAGAYDEPAVDAPTVVVNPAYSETPEGTP